MEIFTILPQWLLTIVLVHTMFFLFLYTLGLKNNLSATVSKPPPSPPKLPIIGNLHLLIGKKRHEVLWQLSKQYGPIMQIFIGSRQFLIISSSNMAMHILRTQDHIFCSREVSNTTKLLTYNFSDVAFSPHSDHWREMRKILVSEFLCPKKATLLNHTLVTEMEGKIHFLSLLPSKTKVNLNNFFREIIKKMVFRLAFGKTYREEPNKGPSFEVMINEIVELMNGSIGDSFPWLGYFINQVSGWNYRLNDGFRNLDAFMDTIIDDHLSHNNGEEICDDERDFLQTLLELSKEENTSDSRLTKADIKALVMDILTGGIDTTVAVMVWTMSEIAKNTRVMQKLQNEIRSCSIQNVAELDTKRLPYLKMVVRESLRLHSPAPYLIPHVSLSHTVIEGYDVSPGTSVLVNAWGIGRDPLTWGENAGEFYPERFENLDDDLERNGFEMLPFGGGRRSCPAKNISPGHVEFVIANLLYWFDWEFPEGLKNEDLDMQSVGTAVLKKKLPLCLCVVPTKKHI